MAAATIDEYLAPLPADQRAALQLLREQIHALVPEATETIAYGIPGFRLEGRNFVGFAAWKAHCSFFPGAAPIAALASELTGYRLHKGTIQFRPDRPIPADLVAKLVGVRLAEYRGR